MAEKNITNKAETITRPSVSYTVEGAPDDYRFVLRGADLVLIDRSNVEHVFLFVGNIMSLGGEVEVNFSQGMALQTEDLFNRSEMVDLQTFYEEELTWDAKNSDEPEKEGNTPNPDGQDATQTAVEAKDIQAAPVKNLKQQLMQALQENENTSKQNSEEPLNRNTWPTPNTNTSDKQGSADDVKPEEAPPIQPPTLAPPRLALTDDTNSGSKLDSVTNHTRPHFEGTANPGASVTLYVNNTAIATTTASDTGEFLFHLDQTLAQGSYSVSVRSALYGKEAWSKVVPLVIDTTRPLLPSIVLASEYDTGIDSTDKVTSHSRPLLQGKFAAGVSFEAGSSLTIEARVHGTDSFLAIGTATVQADGSWSFRLPSGTGLSDGSYDFQLSAQDVAGNRTLSGTSVLSNVTIDTHAPFLGSTVDLTVDSFNPAMSGTNSDFITSDNQFELSGTAGNDARIRAYVDNVLVGETTPVGGVWNFAAGDLDFGSRSVAGNNAVLADGRYALTIIATDRAGNESSPVETTLVIDTAIEKPGITIDGMIEASNGEIYVGADNPVFTVSGEAYSTGTFSLLNTDTGLPVTDDLHVRWNPNTDSYTFTSPSTLADGSYLATFTNTDAAGNENSTSMSFHVDTVLPPSPILTVLDTGSSQSPADPVTNDPALTISFAPGANTQNIEQVRVYLDGSNPPDLDNDAYYLATRQGDAWNLSPQFNAELRTALNDGYDGTTQNYAYTVVVVNRAGITDKPAGEPYQSASFIYDTTAPEPTGIELVTDENNPRFDGSPEDYKTTIDAPFLDDADRAAVDTAGHPIYMVPTNPTFGGSCEVGSKVTVILGDNVNTDPSQTLNTASGSWTIRFGDNSKGETFALTQGEMNKVTILSTDKAGNVSEEVIYIKVLGDPPVAPTVALADDFNTGSVTDNITRGVDGGDPADATDRDGVVKLHGNAPGAAHVTISYVDENGDTQMLHSETGSEQIIVLNGVWESPEVLLTDTAATTHRGTDYTFFVTAYDAANQSSATTAYTATMDRLTTTPTIDLESDSSGPASLDYDGLTGFTDNRTSLTVEGDVLTLRGANAEDGATVWLLHTYNGVTQELPFAEYQDTVLEQGAETGTWVIDLAATDNRILNFGQDGEHIFVVRAMDKAGNVADSAPLAVDFDSTAPEVTSEALDPAHNTAMDQRFVDANPALGALNVVYAGDAVTRNANFTLTGSLGAEATDEADNVAVRVFKDEFQIGVANISTDAHGNVTWSYDYFSGLASGSTQDFTFHVDVTDRAGNTTVGNDFTVTVDRTPPAILGFELLDEHDSFYGAADPADNLGSSTDNYTRSPVLTLTGSSNVAAPVLLEYSLDNGATFTSLYAIANGSTAASGSNWTQDGSGNWTYTVNVDDLLVDLGSTGTQPVQFRATASDAAGNEAAQMLHVSLDRFAPQDTTIDLDADSDSMDVVSGQAGEAAIGSTLDNRTNTDVVTLSGVAEAGARVEIYRVDPGADFSQDGTLLEVVTANAATGAWSLTHSFDTDPAGGVDADGEYEFVAVAVDKAGNRGEAVTLTVHRDTVVGVAATLELDTASNTNATNPVDAGNAADNPLVTAGTLRLDGEGNPYIDKAAITLKGELQNHDPVTEPVAAYIYESGVLVGQATIIGNAWSYDVTGLSHEASYAYTLVVEDSAGNTTASAPLHVVIDASTDAPSVDLVAPDDTAGSHFYADAADPAAGTNDNVTATGRTQTRLADPANAFTLQGDVAEAGSTVTLYVAHSLGNGFYSEYREVSGAVVQPLADGTAWSCIVPNADLTAGDGVYRFKAMATDLSGNTNEYALYIEVDNQAPSMLTNNELWLDNDSGALDLKTNSDVLELRGRLTDTSDTDIVLYVQQGGDEPIRVTDIDWETGQWRLEYAGAGGAVLPEGSYSFVLYAEDRAGNLTTYPADGTFDVLIDRTLDRPAITLADSADTYGGPARADENGDGQPDGASDDYTGFTVDNFTDIHLDINADPDCTVSIYVKNPPDGNAPISLGTIGDPGSGYDLLQAGIQFNAAQGKWDIFVFDGSGYEDQTSQVTLVVVASDGSQADYDTYTFTIDDVAPAIVPGNGLDWEPASETATHISDGPVVKNATNDTSLILSGQVAGEGRSAVTVEIFDATKSSLEDAFTPRVSLGLATINDAGEWTFAAGSNASPLVPAYHLFTARIEDKAGNTTEVSLDEILVDRSTPPTPALIMAGIRDTNYTDGVPDDGYYHDDRGTGSGLDDICYTDNAQPQFNLTGLETLPGYVLTIIVDGGAPLEIPIDEDSRNFIPPNLIDGAHNVVAYVTSATGQESAHAVVNFVVDSVDPLIGQVILAPDSNTGSADDAANPVTKAENPQISGVAEAKAAITVDVRDDKGTADTSDDTVYTAQTVASSGGAWSVTVSPGQAIETGNYSVTVTAIDRAGNASIAEDALSFEVDREVSVIPGSFQIVQSEMNDTGFFDNDHYTANTGPSFSWEAQEEVTARFVLYKNGIVSPIQTIVPIAADLSTTGGVTTWTPSNLDLQDGAYTVKAIFTDTEAGNETAPDDNTVTFTVDTTPTSLSADLASDSGIQGDWVTNPTVLDDPTTVTITGSAPSGTTPDTEVRIQIYLKGADDTHMLLTPSGAGNSYVTTGADGSWSFTIDADNLMAGENDLVIASTDLAGNTIKIEQTLTIDGGTVPGSVLLAAESNSGTYGGDGDFIDNRTNVTAPTLTGTVEPGSTVDLYLGDPDSGGTLIGSHIPTDAAGTWSFDVGNWGSLTDNSADLNGTTYTFVARVTDRAGNVADGQGTVVIDSQAPDVSASYGRILPTPVTAGAQTIYSDTGLNHTDGYTSDTTPTLVGEVAEGHSRVDVYITYPGDDPANPTFIGTTRANASGNWQLEFPGSAAPLTGSALGTDYAISVRTWDNAGNESGYSLARTITIDTSVGNPDAGLADGEVARIRFSADFEAANPPSGGMDPVNYDPYDNTLKTNLTRPTFDVILEPDCDTATLTLIRLGNDGNPVQNPVDDQDIFVINLGPDYAENPPADGYWTNVAFTTSAGQPLNINGQWLLTLTGTDKAGNEFTLAGGQPLIVNGILPEFSMSIVEDQAGEDGHGLYAGDNIVNAASVHFTGTFDADVDWQEIASVSILRASDRTVLRSLDGSSLTGPTWTMEASSVVEGGTTSYSYFVRAVDNYGNEFWYPSADTPMTYAVDRHAPMLNEGSVDLTAADDSAGLFRATDSDNVTTVTTPRISFGSEENAKIELLLDGVLKFTAMPPSPNTPLDGYTFSRDGGVLESTLPAGIAYDADTNRYTYTSDSLAEGDHVFSLRSTDLAGNVSTRDLTVTVDRTYGNADLTAELASASDNGMFADNIVSHDDNLSNDAYPELTGRAEANSAVRIYLQHFSSREAAEADAAFAVTGDDWYDNTPHHEIVLGSGQTSWSWNAANPATGTELADGYYKVIVVSEDKAGNRPDPEVFVFGKDTDAPSQPGDALPLTFHLQDQLEGDGLSEGSATAGEVKHGEILDANNDPIWVTSNWMPTIGGTAEHGSRVLVTLRLDADLDGHLDDANAIYKQLAIDVTDPSGAWSFDFAGEESGAGRLADGIYTATVTCIDPAGNSTTLSPAPQFQVNSTPPIAPTIRLAPDDDTYSLETSNDGITRQNTGLTLTGRAEAGAAVRIYRSEARAVTADLITPEYLAANLLATVTANASGEWSYELSTDFETSNQDSDIVEDGRYRFFVASDYFNGNTYYSLQQTDASGQAIVNGDGSPVLVQPVEIEDGQYLYPDYVLEVDTLLHEPTFELGLTLDTTSGDTEEERRANSSRTDSGIDNEWRTPEEIAAGVYLGEPDDFWETPDELNGQGTYDDWIVKTSGPTIEGTVEAGSTVHVQRFMAADLTNDGVDNPVNQWVTVGIVDAQSTSGGIWRFVFPAQSENAEYLVRIHVLDRAGNEYTSPEKTIIIDAAIRDTVLDLPDDQDTALSFAGVASGTAWADIPETATLEGLDYVQKGHVPVAFQSGNNDDLTKNNNLLLHGEVEVGSRMYLTDTRQGVTVRITPVLIVDPAQAGEDEATEAYYVKTGATGDVGTWTWMSADAFAVVYGADYAGAYFHVHDDGSWDYRTGELTDAQHAYTIQNIDLAGNQATTTPLSVTVDHVFTSASMALTELSDTYFAMFRSNDLVTKDDTPSFRLYGDSGATYLLYAFRVGADGAVGENVNADGSPVATGLYSSGADTVVEIPLADGGYQLRLVNISESGHVSEAIYPPTEADGTYVPDTDWDVLHSAHPLVIDTEAPIIPDRAALEAIPGYLVHVEDQDPSDVGNEWTREVTSGGRVLPVIVSGDARDVDGRGVITADLITTDNTPTIQIFVEPGSMISVFGMGYNTILTDSDNDGIISLNPASDRNDGNPLGEGTYNLSVTFSDIAGNVAEPRPMTFSVTIDSQTTWWLTDVRLDPASDTGAAGDNLTRDATPMLSGTVSATDTVRYRIRVGGTTIERHIGDADYGVLIGDSYHWTYTPTLANGKYNVSVISWDRAGNQRTDWLETAEGEDTPLIVHQAGELALFASCDSINDSRILLGIDYSTSNAFNDETISHVGNNQLHITYHFLDGTSSSEVVQLALGETDYVGLLRADAGYDSIEFKLVDSAGNESGTGVVDIGSGPDGDGAYSITGVAGSFYDIRETAEVDFDLSGSLTDDNLADATTLDDVETIRATISGDLDGDGTSDAIMTVDAETNANGDWSLSFTKELAVGDYHLNLSALAADGSEVALASTTDLNYDFSVLAKDMLADPADSQILFNEAAENTEPAGSETPAPGAVDTVTIVDPHVTIEEHVL